MAEEQRVKLAKTAVSSIDFKDWAIMDQWISTEDIDKLSIPKKYESQVDLCRFFYKRDSVAGTVINKIVDLAITALDVQSVRCNEVEKATYKSMLPMLRTFFRSVCLEYLLSGVVIPHYEWEQLSGDKLSPDLNSRRRIWVPNNIWFRDPKTIRLERSVAIPNKINIKVKVDYDLINFIKTGGKKKDGTMDKETFEALKANYPKFVENVSKMKGTTVYVELEDNVRPIFAPMLVDENYPIPYMFNALEPLMHKRNIRKMDYSIAARVISAIQLIKLGSDKFPVTDEEDFDELKRQMEYRGQTNQTERVFQLFANHTLQIEWVFPDTEAMLNQEKYREADDDIVAALGFPRSLITGETLRSMTNQADLAIFSPIATMETIRDVLIQWANELFLEIRDRNKFKAVATPKFQPLHLYSLRDLVQMGQELYKEGHISRDTRVRMFNIDLEAEVEKKADEKKLYDRYDLDAFPPTPYSPLPPPLAEEEQPTNETQDEEQQ